MCYRSRQGGGFGVYKQQDGAAIQGTLCRAVGPEGMGGGMPPPHILEDKSHYYLPPPGFSDLPTALVL